MGSGPGRRITGEGDIEKGAYYAPNPLDPPDQLRENKGMGHDRAAIRCSRCTKKLDSGWLKRRTWGYDQQTGAVVCLGCWLRELENEPCGCNGSCCAPAPTSAAESISSGSQVAGVPASGDNRQEAVEQVGSK